MKQTGILILLISAISLLVYCTDNSNKKKATLTSYASLNDTVKYVGMQACKQCHESIYNTYIETGMGQSFDIASKQKSKASFTHSTIYDKHKNFFYHSYWQGDSLKFMEYRLDDKDTIHKRIETVHYIVGSGQHTNSHMINTNGYFNQAPMTYYTQKGIWDVPPGFENGNNTRFSREIGLECMSCHNSFPDFVLGSQNKYSNVPNGITCERCHGPGAMHVREKIAGNIVDVNSQIDYTIVNPAKLPIDKQFDVCQRCHIQGNAVLNEGKSFFDFKPGMSLSEVMNVFMPVYTNSKDHIMASHAERLKQSKCYLVSIQKAESSATKNNLKPYKDALTCVTCHDPHVSVRKTEKDFFNKKCIACHSGKETLCTADKIELSKKNNNCVSCHMQTSGATDIPHVRVHDHRISVPLTDDDAKSIKQFVTIACINNPLVDKRTMGKAYIAYFEKFELGKEMLDSAKKYLPSNTDSDIKTNFHELVHLAYLQNDYKALENTLNKYKTHLTALTKKSPDNRDAYTAYRIAQMLETANPQQAFDYYKRAIELAPEHIEFLNKYGNILFTLNQPQEALAVFKKLVALFPKHVQGLSNLGYLEMMLNVDYDAALKNIGMAIALDPDYEQAYINKAAVYAAQSKLDEATLVMKQYIKYHPQAVKSKQTLNQLRGLNGLGR